MRVNRLRWFLLFLLGSAVFQLPAQQSEADRKLLADIRARAEKSDAQAQFELGVAFGFGTLGIAKDAVVAVMWYRKAAEQGFAPAQYNLGVCYEQGKGAAKDEAAAVIWYRKAAEQMLAAAQYNLGVCYYRGHGVAKDAVEAVRWVRKAAEQNLARAQNGLGLCYGKGQGVAKDAAEAVMWYRKAAEQNFARAQNNLGLCYAAGRGLPKDEVEAVKWLRKAADQNDPEAQYNLGTCYLEGEGVGRSQVEAVKWFRKAAEQNDSDAQFNLGVLYTKGEGVVKDEVEAAKWIRKAAEQNHAIAQFNLGQSYLKGRGVPKDEIEGAKWIRTAAEQDCAVAQRSLGALYANGQGVAKDEVEAVKWIRKAAEHGNSHAQCDLGLCCAYGQGVAKNYVEAYKWGLLASLKGDANAKELVRFLEERMTREQVAEGQELARRFRPREVAVAKADRSGVGIMETHPECSGTGFFISEDGYLITNDHVVQNGLQVRLVTEAGLISARVVKVDVANDLALLKAEGKFAPLPVVSSRAMKMGSTIATIGFPNIGLQGFAPKLAKGEIAALSGAQDDPRYFQISVPVQPGNSGGALVDERGNVVGVVAAKLNVAAAVATSGALPENVNYAVKSSLLLSFLESVPEVAAKLKEPGTKDSKFEDVVKSAEKAAVLVLVY